MKIYDISIPITPHMPVYPGDPPVVFEARQRMANGDPANVSYCGMGTHTGTHIDAPFHFVDSGRKVGEIPLNLLIGRTRIVEITAPRIDEEVLSEVDLDDHVRVIFKTRNSYLWSRNTFVQEYVHVTPGAARKLVENGIKLVGIDYLSIEKFGSTSFPTHLELLSNGVVIIEGLNLSEVDAGEYELICLPMKLQDSDGAPARVILRG
ncbi:MAG TPA: cyclase family protein [Acidobacteriota bacterium]|nr:cyclase family protein [Acidobacteriota bacterium]